jgi:hypothetical protein
LRYLYLKGCTGLYQRISGKLPAAFLPFLNRLPA